MRICLVGLENLPVLAPEYKQHTIGGESVQQTLLARALARAGHDVTMVVGDYGQDDGAEWSGIRAYKAYAPDAGVPVLRFVHPRWTGLWSALARADADVYYTSCAGMHVGLLALFCRHRGKQFGKRFVFRTASDTDCDGSRLLVRYARDRWLYEYGLRRAHAILVQSAAQAAALERNYGLAGRVAGMLVEQSQPAAERDIDALWVSNIRREKRPDRALELARELPEFLLHMVGGPLPGAEDMYRDIKQQAMSTPNALFHGPLSYWDANALYGRARVFVNTSDIEGFPNSYLQAWMRGVPVITFIDPDGIIEREGLGIVMRTPGEFPGAVRTLLNDAAAWQAASDRCRAYMEREHGEGRVLAPYLETFERVRRPAAASAILAAAVQEESARHA